MPWVVTLLTEECTGKNTYFIIPYHTTPHHTTPHHTTPHHTTPHHTTPHHTTPHHTTPHDTPHHTTPHHTTPHHTTPHHTTPHHTTPHHTTPHHTTPHHTTPHHTTPHHTTPHHTTPHHTTPHTPHHTTPHHTTPHHTTPHHTIPYHTTPYTRLHPYRTGPYRTISFVTPLMAYLLFRNSSSNSVECLLCPYGGRCAKGLQVLPNFWGYKIKMDPPTIQFSRCPVGYCCQPTSSQKSCFPYNTCKSGRHGRLCGACKPGYTETLFTTSCRKSEKCKDYWFWPVAVIFVLSFSLYLIIQPDIPGFLYRSITWFRPKPPQVIEIRAANDLSEEIQVSYFNSDDSRTEDVSKDTTNSLERIVFFYYQAIDILSVQGSYNATWDSHLTKFTLGLFNFDIRLNKEGFACPFPGLKPVSKLLFHTLGVFSVLFAIPCIFLLDKAVSVCFSNRTPKIGLYLSAFLKSVILGYTVLANKSLTLLQCVTVDGVYCLFVDCNIECYTWWQTLIGTLVLIYFFPFVVVLFFGAKKLYKKQISVVHFFLACLFPLPFLSYWFLHRRHLRNEIVADTSGRTAVTSILIGSYRAPDHVSSGTTYWESVLIGRMLLLILAAVLIGEPFRKSLTLVLLCIINLSVHISFHPYERTFDNHAETISLFCLVLMAMFNLPFMAYFSEGVVPSSPMSHMMNVFSWCQVVLVGFLPFVWVLLVLLALVSQAVRLVLYLVKGFRLAFTCFSSCRFVGRRRRQDEHGDPLIG